MASYNKLAHHIHSRMKSFGFYKKERELGTILLLIVTEMVKLYDDNKLNKAEKLADITMRLYDYCGYKNIKINNLEYVDYDLHKMVNCITNEFEGYRADIETKHCYIIQCLEMCYSYAKDNNINLNKEIMIKLCKLKKIRRSKTRRKF